MIEIYKERYSNFSRKSEQLAKQLRIVSMLRLVVFIIGIFLIYYFAGINAVSVTITAILFLSAFVFLVRYHSKKHRYKKHIDNLKEINHKEIKALEGDFRVFENGNQFLEPDHPYTADLDIFGEGSLFQFINRTATLIGRNKIAQWLRISLKDKEEILSRQEAVKDLKDKLDWRQNFRALGYGIDEKETDEKEILDWVKEDENFNHWIFLVILLVVPPLNIIFLVLHIVDIIPFSAFLLYLILPVVITLINLRKVNAQHMRLSKKSKILNKYASLLKEVEIEEFGSPMLKYLKESLRIDSKNASESIKKLSKILNALDSRLNMIAGVVLNYLFMWDLLQTKRLELWRRKYRTKIEDWLNVIAVVDALCCYSNFFFNDPECCFPGINKSGNILKAKNAGHPIIDKTNRVDNDIFIDKAGQFLIITGANMAGKSTYLRTIGINMVMAMAGMPVCATSFQFIPIDLFTSMRTKDSLYKNESYFYAELRRMKMIIDKLKEEEPLLVILDEVLKGTNSKDKLTGSKALIAQFVQLNAAGVIATHDLLLGEMINEFPENIKNYCFEVDIKDNKLYFDYKLRPGISQNLNATFLMQKMGITVIED